MMKQRIILLTMAMLVTAIVSAQSTDTASLPYTADFMQGWTATGGTIIIDSNHASITSQGQTLTSPWINVPSITVYYHFTDRRDTTGTYWNTRDSAIWYSVTVEDADGGIVTTANWDSESSSQGILSSFPAPGGPIRFVFTYTDTHAVQLHYIENLEIYAYDMTLTVEGPTSVHVGDTVVYTAHVSMPEGEQPDYWNWTLYDHSYNNVDSSIATVIATTDSTRTIVWHTSGDYRLFTSVQKYIPQMVWQYLYYTITVLDTTTPTPVDCDSIFLPYTADFTQCWMAEGAVVIDSNHVSMISVGQKITSPWMESVAGKTFFNYEFLRDGEYSYDYDNEQITVIVENENGVIQRYVEYPAWSYSPWFENPGGRIRISFEYTGRRAVPSCRLSNVSLYQYEIENAIEGPGIARVGDTVIFTAHATLQDNEMADYYYWYMYVYNANGSSWVNDDDPSRTIVSHTDSTLVVVWNTPGRYSVTSSVYKNNVYHNSNAYASDRMYINVVNFPFYEEDSIYYTSAAKDTVIGCHPDLHVANLPESVTVIVDSAFFNLSNLSIIELPIGLRTIGKMAFAWNQGISEITIPQNVTFVGDNAFWWDTNLTTVNFNAINCQTMSPSTNEDGNYWPVFIGCDNITTINIGENVTRIPDRAFSYCSGLHGTLTIPDAVTYIGRSAFYHWINDWDWDNGSSWDTLSIVLGAGLSEIGDYAFGCPRAHITSVISHNPEPPIIGEQTFYRYGPEYTPRLQVPCGSAATYRNAQHWSRIEEIIEDCDGIEDAENDARTPAILSDNGIITVVGATELVSVYDMMGRLVSAYMPTDFRCTIVVPHSGVYMVKIGDCPARKIVVIK